ncbi:MAG: hypothetical protein AB7O97_13000 [Planctomycetota bacterium]
MPANRRVAAIALFATAAIGQVAPTPPPAPQAETRAAPTGPRSAERQMADLLAEVQQGNGEALWRQLPPSYRDDVERLVRAFGARVDAQVYDRSMALVGRLARVGAAQRERFFATPLLRASLESEPELAGQRRLAFDAVVRVLQELGDGPLRDVDGLQQFDGAVFAAGPGSSLLRSVLRIAEERGIDTAAALADTHIATVRDGADRATLRMTADGEPAQLVTLVCVEGHWLPQALAQGWDRAMARANAAVAAMPETPDQRTRAQARMVLDVFGTLLKGLEDADTQAEFDAAMARVTDLAQRGGARRAAGNAR